jgi:hypothetical protein
MVIRAALAVNESEAPKLPFLAGKNREQIMKQHMMVIATGLVLTGSWAFAQEPPAAGDPCLKGWPEGTAIVPGPPNRCRKIPPGAVPVPSGYFVCQWRNLQAARAAEDRFVIYRHEWYQGGSCLGPYGRYHLNLIARQLPEVPFAVIIEPEGRDEANEMRRQLVIHYLAQHGIPDAAQRVVVAFPRAEGIYGDEAPRIFYRMLRGGAAGGGTTGFGGGFGGGAMGGAAPFGGVGGGLGGFGSVR